MKLNYKPTPISNSLHKKPHAYLFIGMVIKTKSGEVIDSWS